MRKIEKPWDKNLQLLLVLIVGFNTLPHMTEIPFWVTAITFFCLGWKMLYLFRGFPLPQRRLLWSGSVLVGVGVFVQYGTILGQEAASALLVFLASSKLLETNRYRDAMLVIFTSYFLLMAHLLNSQSLLSTLFMAVDVLLITSLMFQIHKRDRRRSIRSFRPAMRMLTIALPVWIFLFVAFPRFSAGLMKFNKQTAPATGFSDDLNPGSIERLIESEEPAFRVNFAGGRMLPPDLLYWRGSVLSEGYGLKWQPLQNKRIGPDKTLPSYKSQRKTTYEVWLEPHFKNWLFVLDFPIDVIDHGRLKFHQVSRKNGLIFETRHEIKSRIVYSGVSSLQSPRQELSEAELALFSAVPENLPQRITDLARKLKENSSTITQVSSLEMKMSQSVLNWFDEEDFRYTRSPGSLSSSDGVQQLDEFLFERKRGFCEHFAASYASLMRVMGVPSRVMVGFQGGQVNALGDYLIVRNLDAHAWAEIWLADEPGSNQGQWVRVDPTSTIAPMRIQLGGDYYRLDSDLIASGLTQDEIRRGLDRGLTRFYREFSMVWDTAQMRWNQFLLRYDFDYQRSLLEKLGLKNVSRLAVFGWVIIGVLIFIGALHFTLRKKAHSEDPLTRTWRRFCRALERSGITRQENEGPLSFSRRAAQKLPALQDEILEIADTFIDLRYGPPTSDTNKRTRKLTQSVRRFSRRSNSV